MDANKGKKLTGLDITLFNKRYFASMMRVNVVATVISIPYLYNLYTVASAIRNKKKETGQIKLTPSDALRLFGTDFVIMTVGLVSYLVLKQKGGLQVAGRYVEHNHHHQSSTK